MAYWTCSKCGEEHHDAFVVCWKCSLPRPDQLKLAEKPASVSVFEYAPKERLKACAKLWAFFLLLTAFSQRGEMALFLPLYIFWFPAGLLCLFPRHSDVSPVELLTVWAFYFGFTTLVVGTPQRKTFKALMLVLALILTANMIGCYRVLR